MNIKDILAALNKGADFVEAVAPVATILGGPMVGMVTGVISAVSEIATNIQERANEGKVVFGIGDAAQIQVVLDRITAANDSLNKAIEQS